MNHVEDLLLQIARIARSGRDFFVAAEPRINDAEIRMAFEYIGQVKGRLAADLAPFVARTQTAQPTPAPSVSAAANIEKMYRDIGAALPRVNRVNANALASSEEHLLRLVERAFETSQNAKLKELLKLYYPQLVICREAMTRLRARQAA